MIESNYLEGTGPVTIEEMGRRNEGEMGRRIPISPYKGRKGVRIISTAPEAGQVTIWSVESTLGYSPEKKRAIIVAPDKDAKIMKSENVFRLYQTLMGYPLKDIVLDIVGQGVNCTVRNDTIDEDECKLLEWGFPSGVEVRVWVATSKGCAIKKHEMLRDGLVTRGYTATLQEYAPGLWCVNSVKARGRSSDIEISVDSLLINEPIDPSVFTLAGINIPHGTRVIDRITGKGYYHVNIPSPPSLIGRPLPEFKDFRIELSTVDMDERSILLCLFDMDQRPSRNCLRRLSEQARELKAKDAVIVAVQASKIDGNTLSQWVKKNNIPFPVGMVQGDEEKTRFAWAAKSLPWLILTDQKHIVISEGFQLGEMADQL